MIIKTKRGTNQHAQRGIITSGWVCKNGHMNEDKFIFDPFPRIVNTDFCQRKGCSERKPK